MTFIYDIVLNFTVKDKYFDIYEWKKEDYLINIKKAPLFRVDKNIICNLINSDIKVGKKFLESIKRKSITSKRDDYSYICIFSDCEKSIGVCFNDKGYVVYKSSLLIDEEIDANRLVTNKNFINLDYSLLKKVNNNFLRDDITKINYVLDNLNNSYQKREFGKLRYLYFDIFGTCLNNNKKIFHELKSINKYYYLIDRIYYFYKNGNKIIEI